MSININDLNGNNRTVNSSFLNIEETSNNLRKLSKEELKISGGGERSITKLGADTVIISDDDLDIVYIPTAPLPINFTYNASNIDVKSGGKINFDDGNVMVEENGDINITVSDSESSSAG